MRPLHVIRDELRKAWGMVGMAEAARAAGRPVSTANFIATARALEWEYNAVRFKVREAVN